MNRTEIQSDNHARRIARLEKTVGSLIAYLHRELGTHQASKLLKMLDAEDSQ